MFFDLNIFSQDFFIYLLVLFLSPIILFTILALFNFLISLIFKRALNLRGNVLLESVPEFSLIEKSIDANNEKEVLIRNFRNAKYATHEYDVKVAWENRKFKLKQLDNIELFVDHYAPLQSHAILIFNFIDEHNVCKKMCVSYEIKHEACDTAYYIKAIYKNYYAGYVVGSFEDLVGVRFLRYVDFHAKKISSFDPKYLENLILTSNSLTSNFRKLGFYKLNFTQAECRQIFISLMSDVNVYARKQFLYSFLCRNCLSEIFKHFRISNKFKFNFFQFLSIKRLLLRNNVLI